jgi:hypothetical protein
MNKFLLLMLAVVIILWALVSTEPNNSYVESYYKSYDSSFCKGWEEGYCEGWKSIRGLLVSCPGSPGCPGPRGLESSYKDGYNRGFLKGRKDASR